MQRVMTIAVVLTLVFSVSAFPAGEQERLPGDIDLWTAEGEADGGLDVVETFAEEFEEQNPDVDINVVDHDVEDLREDFQTASLAGQAPELLWTVNDHAGPFTQAGLIQPVQDFYNEDEFIEPLEIGGDYWGVPITSGNHLMLMYNKSLVDEAPETTDEMIEMSQQVMDEHDGVYGFTYDSVEPFWLVPWLGGFGGEVFAEDGVTPTLDTPEMVDTLQFLWDLEYEYEIVPENVDYDTMEALFSNGEAAFAVLGDWAIGQMRDALGDDLGIAPLPIVSETGERPAPYTSGQYFMIAEHVEGEQLEIILDFIEFVTAEEQQRYITEQTGRLPARLAVQEDPVVTDDELLQASAEQMELGVPMPSVMQMRANWDAMLPEQNAVLTDDKDPAEAAADMQSIAESAIEEMDPTDPDEW